MRYALSHRDNCGKVLLSFHYRSCAVQSVILLLELRCHTTYACLNYIYTTLGNGVSVYIHLKTPIRFLTLTHLNTSKNAYNSVKKHHTEFLH